MWQKLLEELTDTGFLPIAVAFDARGPKAARPWIEAAKPTYPCLIDANHRVAELYNMINVPQAVWIDEEGIIVRPTETAGSSDAFRRMDRTTGKMPEDDAAASRARRTAYLDALRDWAHKGSASQFVMEADKAESRTKALTPEQTLGNANFRLGEYLHRAGKVDQAQAYLTEAKRLRPESWAFKRQAWNLEHELKAGGPEFWAAVEALGDSNYYEPAEL